MFPSSSKSSFPHILKDLFATPIDSYGHWCVIIVVALMFVFTPQLPPPSDWERNTAGLFSGLRIYEDPSSVYPPWSLILLWPYYFMTAPGSRLGSVLVMGWLAAQQRWTLLRFGAIVASPFFLWTMVISNMDVLALLFPVVLWRSSEGRRWQWLGWSASLLVLLIKPQGGVAIILYLLWKHRNEARALILPLMAVALVAIPISLLGTPPLIVQWLDNTFVNPSNENLEFWNINNVSLADHLGFLPGVIIVIIAIGGLYGFMRLRGHQWTQNHTVSSIFLVSMLLSPYASNQGVIVPLALVPSWPAVALQYIVLYTFSSLGVFRENSAWFALLFGVSALWLYVPRPEKQGTGATDAQSEA